MSVLAAEVTMAAVEGAAIWQICNNNTSSAAEFPSQGSYPETASQTCDTHRVSNSSQPGPVTSHLSCHPAKLAQVLVLS